MDGEPKKGNRRGSYEKFTPEIKSQIAKRAAEHGVASTVRYYSGRFLKKQLKESTVRTWRNLYLSEMRKRKRANQDM